jgi:hypothetical protein
MTAGNELLYVDRVSNLHNPVIWIGILHHYCFSANSLPSPSLLTGNFLVFPTLLESLQHDRCMIHVFSISWAYLTVICYSVPLYWERSRTRRPTVNGVINTNPISQPAVPQREGDGGDEDV